MEELIGQNTEGPPGPEGPQGPEGPAGPQGPAGAVGLQISQRLSSRNDADQVGSQITGASGRTEFITRAVTVEPGQLVIIHGHLEIRTGSGTIAGHCFLERKTGTVIDLDQCRYHNHAQASDRQTPTLFAMDTPVAYDDPEAVSHTYAIDVMPDVGVSANNIISGVALYVTVLNLV